MTANVTLKGNGRAQRTTLHVLGQSQEKGGACTGNWCRHSRVKTAYLSNLSNDTVVIQGADSLLCRLSWHCPCPLPFGCHSHCNTELPAKRCLMSSWRWGKVRRTRIKEMEGLVLGKGVAWLSMEMTGMLYRAVQVVSHLIEIEGAANSAADWKLDSIL